MIALYGVYVLSAVLNEIYIKMKKTEKRRQSTIDSNQHPEQSLTKKVIMPALGIFSNESMRQLPQMTSNHSNGHTMRDSLVSMPGSPGYASLGGGHYQSFGMESQMSVPGSFMKLSEMSMHQHSLAGETNAIEEANEEYNNQGSGDDDDGYDSIEKMSDILSSILSERAENKKNRHWLIRYLSFIMNIPPMMNG